MPMSEHTDFQQLQRRFAGHIRSAHTPIIDGIEPRRMAIYRALFFNNIEGFTASAFPVAKAIMGQAWWHGAVRDFIRDYRCDSPYFHQISSAFLTFISELRPATPDQPDFLTELMHYEWVELALEIATPDPFSTALPSTDLLNDHPVQSSLAWSLSYRYPVHTLSVDYQPSEAPEQPSWLLVYRDRHDTVHFTHLNAFSARLLYLLAQSPTISGRQALLHIAKESNHPDPTALVSAGQQLLEQFYHQDVLLGAHPLKESAVCLP